MSKSKCPNYLFCEWLSQWQADAAKKGLNSMHTYAKAIRSLQKYPLQFSSGKECIILEHFGPKLCQMLDEQIDKYKAVNGPLSFPPIWVEESAKTKKASSKKRTSPVTNELSEGSTDVKILKVSKDYIPQYRSGPYALVMSLQQNVQPLSKKDLLLMAQHLSDSSFTVPVAGSRYTAWSSMGSLIKKGFVSKTGSPAKYCLTPAGLDLAHRMLALYAIAQPASAGSSWCITSDTTAGAASARVSDVPTSDSGLNVSQELVDSRKQWSFELSDDEDLMMVEESDKTVVVPSDSDSDLDVTAPRKPAACGCVTACKGHKQVQSCMTSTSVASGSNISSISALPTAAAANLAHIASNVTSAVSTNLPRTQPPVTVALKPAARAQQDVVCDDASCDSEDVGAAVNANFVFTPNSFNVVLCVDSCELLGGAHTSTKQQMLMELSRLAVPFEVRKLNLGDFLWIAREKVASGSKPRELVLGHIVERKRMDDLAGSICDGRFHEQKFRLKTCGLRSVIYLVEDYGKSQQHFSISEDALNQAIINTQIVDKFFVRRTRDTVDSAAYLALLTQQLQWRHQVAAHVMLRKTLKSGVMADITRSTTIIADTYPTFEDFNAASSKSKDWCVRDMFAKHLIQLHGLTIDKAAAILQHYPSPAHLQRAWLKCESDTSKQNMLALIKCGHMKRNLGSQLSKIIFQLYCQPTLQ